MGCGLRPRNLHKSPAAPGAGHWSNHLAEAGGKEGWSYIRDTQLPEDAHLYRGNGAGAMDTLRNAALNLLPMAALRSIQAAMQAVKGHLTALVSNHRKQRRAVAETLNHPWCGSRPGHRRATAQPVARFSLAQAPTTTELKANHRRDVGVNRVTCFDQGNGCNGRNLICEPHLPCRPRFSAEASIMRLDFCTQHGGISRSVLSPRTLLHSSQALP